MCKRNASFTQLLVFENCLCHELFTYSFVTEVWLLEIHSLLSDLALICKFSTLKLEALKVIPITSPDMSTVNPCNIYSESHSLLQDNTNDRVQSFRYCFLMQFFWNVTVLRIIVKIKFNSSPQFLEDTEEFSLQKTLQKLTLHFQIL